MAKRSTSISADAHEQQTFLSAFGGMRREWNFSLKLAHKAARVVMQLLPQWEATFIDPREIEELHRLDRDVKHCPMMSALRFTDLSAAMKPNNELWTEIPKQVSILYSHIPPNMTLVAYCIRSVQHVLADPNVISVDGSSDLLHLRVGDKLRCLQRLGGHRSFQFRYHRSEKSKLTKGFVYAIGTIINQRGYLCTVQCSEEEELLDYVENNFLPQFTNPEKFALDQDVVYEEVTSAILKAQHELFGELRYFDADAAVAFSIPMHPMRIRPDFSPTQTVGVGSIACMTLELDVHQRLIDEFAEAEITGLPRYKVNQVILFLDVEDVARMGYPKIMSTEQYSHLKTNRLLDIFSDAKVVGTPVTVSMGPRTSRCCTLTLTYEPLNSLVKIMTASAIVGSFGVSAVYLTKVGGGIFDAHLYLQQQLLKSIKLCDKTVANAPVSRFRTLTVRLAEQNIPRAYSGSSADEHHVIEQHLKFLRESNDGRVERGVVIPVPPEEGGLSRLKNKKRSRQSQSFGDGIGVLPSFASSSHITGPRGSDGGIEKVGDGTFVLVVEESGSISEGDVGHSSSSIEGSLHSSSVISVTSISRLHGMIPYDTVADGGAHVTPLRRSSSSMTVTGTDSVDAAGERVIKMMNTVTTTPFYGQQSFHESTDFPVLSATEALERDKPRKSSSVSPLTVERPTWRSSLVSNLTEHRGSAEVEVGADQLLLQQQQQERMLREALKEEEADVYFGPSLHDVYVRSCDMQRCRPNSYLLKKLPTNPRFTSGVRELDLSSNYLGHSGFVAVLNLLEHLPSLLTVHFNDMSLDNTDAEHLCEALEGNGSIQAVYLRNNRNITLSATRFFTRLIRVNKNIVVLSLEGTRVGNSVIKKIEEDARRNASKSEDAVP